MSPSKKKQQSNQTLERNLKALEQKQPLLVQRIREFMRTQMKSGAKFSLQMEETPRGTWWKGFYDEPFFESNAALNAIPEGTKPVLVVAGIGTPRYLTGLLNRIKRRQFVILLEPSIKLFLFLLESSSIFDHKAPFEVLPLLAGDDALLNEMQQAAFGHRGHFVGGIFDVHSHPGEMEVASEAFRETLKQYVGRINFQMQRLGDSAEDTLLGFRQMALATPWILFRERLAPLKGKFKGFSGVVLSAGPSLDKNLHLLKGLEDRLVLVCADTLLGKMAAQGIRPHFVCALERGAATYEKYFRPYYDTNEPSLKDIVLVVQSVCFPQIAGRWPGRLCVVGKESINLDREVIAGALGGDVLPSGSSVAHMGMGLLAYLGVDRIALVGQDLAFGEDGRTHTNQTAWDASGGDELKEQRISVPAALGGTVQTTRVWKFFIDTFEEMIPKMPCAVWDCTEGGALIRGTEIRPLADYLRGVGSSASSSFAIVDEELGADWTDDRSSLVLDRLAALRGTFQKSAEQIAEGRRSLDAIGGLPHEREILRGPVNQLYDLLQRIVEENAMLAYIGQSYLSILLGDEARLNLADEEEFALWRRSHEEYFEAQERALLVFGDWLEFMTTSAISAPVFQELEIMFPANEERIRPPLEGFLARSQERPLELNEIVVADLLHSRVDPVSARWEPTFLWAMARHLHGEGRFLEASNHFQASIEAFEGRNISVDFAAALLKERARALMGRDLCWTGNALEALTSLANAYGYTPEDEEIPLLLQELLRRRREDLEDLLIREQGEGNRKYLHALIEGLGKELAALEKGGEERADVVRRYLVDILREKRPVAELPVTKDLAPEYRQEV
jgi:hypothetical protein